VSVLAGHTPAVSFESAAGAGSGRVLQSAVNDALRRWAAGDGVYTESHDDFV
jgi:hypothetical protein